MKRNIKISGSVNPKKYTILVTGIFDKIMAKLDFAYSKEIEIIFYDSRKSLDKTLGRSTENWEVAFASMGNKENKINILNPERMEKFSCHKKTEFASIITHELTHLVINDIANGSAIPVWLSEGLSNWLCQNNDYRKKELFYIETGLLEKIGTPKGWEELINQNVYSLSYFLVDFIINRFTLVKIKELINNLDKHYYFPRFQKILKSILGVSSEEIELAFVKYLISQNNT
ncbi:MAG: hypothetical protein PHZ25_03410 [Candidatus Pacebacteria bacterium]|nr:hypothetical protein [Candidatus Paceibacterota bacterium]